MMPENMIMVNPHGYGESPIYSQYDEVYKPINIYIMIVSRWCIENYKTIWKKC